MVMIIRKPLVNLVEQNCDNLFSGECIGTNVNVGRLKRESKATVIYQYPYEFEYQNAGLCWIQAGMPCDYFEKYILPLYPELIDEYNKLDAIEEVSEFCNCGREIGINNERKCMAEKITKQEEGEIKELVESALSHGTDDITGSKLEDVLSEMIMPFHEFETLDLPERMMLLSPWIQESDIILISGAPGVGKTWFSMEICSAIQNGRAAMVDLWKVENPVKCLYCDGESHWDDIKRMGAFIGLGDTQILSKTYLENHDVNPSLNLDTVKVRDIIYDYIIENEIKFVVLDNLFSLWAGIDLDNAKEWHESNQWLLKLRSKSVCAALLHHTNKVGGQMGTASKLFNINTALILNKTPSKGRNNKVEEIVSFRIKVEKQRAKGTGLDAYTFTCNDGAWSYTDKKEGTVGSAEDSKAQLILPLLLDDKIEKQKEIAEFVGCNPSYISQIKNEHKDLFESDSKPNSKGQDLLKKNREMLQSFYKKEGIGEKVIFKSKG
jgi:hypothetical protein